MPTEPTDRDADLVAALKAWAETFAMRSLHDWALYMKAAGLSMPQFGALMRLYHGGTCSVSDIAGHLETTRATASQLIDRLVTHGIVARHEDPRDRRARNLSLTAKGRSLIEEGIRARFRWVEALVAGLDEERKRAIRAALPALVEPAHSHTPADRARTRNSQDAHTSTPERGDL